MNSCAVKSLCMTIALLATAAVPAQQTVWRCGPGGNSYSNQPCASGREVAVDDNRSSTDAQAAREVAARDRAQAQTLRKDRLQREAEQRAQGSGLAGFSPAKPAPAAKPPPAPVVAKVKKTAKAKVKRPPIQQPPPAAAGTSAKAARASRRAPG